MIELELQRKTLAVRSEWLRKQASDDAAARLAGFEPAASRSGGARSIP